MAIQTFPSLVPFPFMDREGCTTGAPAVGNASLDNTADRYALVCRPPKAGNIHKIRFYNGTVTGVSGSVALDCRIETVDATNGQPSGTLFATNTNGAVTVQFDGDNSWQVATLTADAAVDEDDYIAIVINPTSFTTVTAIAIVRQNAQIVVPYSTYRAENLTGSYALDNEPPSYLLEYDDGTFAWAIGTWVVNAITTTTINTGTATTRIAAKMQVPWPCRSAGAWVWVNPSADYNVVLYDPDGSTVRASIAQDANILPAATIGLHYLRWEAPYTLAANTNYYVALEPAGVSNISGYHSTFPTVASLDGVPGGQTHHLALFTSSAWVPTTTSKPFIGMLLDGFDDGAGSGGGLILPKHMSGGLV